VWGPNLCAEKCSKTEEEAWAKSSIPRRLMFADDTAMTVGSEEDSDKRYRSSVSKKGNKKGEKTWRLSEKETSTWGNGWMPN